MRSVGLGAGLSALLGLGCGSGAEVFLRFGWRGFCNKEGVSSALTLGCHVCYCQRPGWVIREISGHSSSQDAR